MRRTAASQTSEVALLNALNAAIDAFETFAPEHLRCVDRERRLLESLQAAHAKHPSGVAITRMERSFAVGESCFVSRDCGLVQLEQRFQAMGLSLLNITPGITRE